ncbi:hypothetical protein IAR50_004007 [Cryptococcus sp. DSM 104548]
MPVSSSSTRSSSRVRSKPPAISPPPPAATRTNHHSPVAATQSLPRASSDLSIASFLSSPSLLELPPSHTPFLAGLQSPAIVPWSSSEPYLEWVPDWWHDESCEEFKHAAIDKKSENEWDYLESAWLDRSHSTTLGRRRFTTPQLQLLEVQWSLDASPEKVERQRLARYMGTRTKHVNIWLQNRRQYTKRTQAEGIVSQPAYVAVEGVIQPTPAMQSIVRMIAAGDLHHGNCLAMAASHLKAATSRLDRSARRKPPRLRALMPALAKDATPSSSAVTKPRLVPAKSRKHSLEANEEASTEDEVYIPRHSFSKRPREKATSINKQKVDSDNHGKPRARTAPEPRAFFVGSAIHSRPKPEPLSLPANVTHNVPRPIPSSYGHRRISLPIQPLVHSHGRAIALDDPEWSPLSLPALSRGSSSASSPGSFEQMASVPRAWPLEDEVVSAISTRKRVGHGAMLKDEVNRGAYWLEREYWDILDAADILVNMGRRASV